MTATEATAVPLSPSSPTLPSPLRIGLSRGALELKTFFREKDAVVFTFSLPAGTGRMTAASRQAVRKERDICMPRS